ncbi:DUF1615 family protein [Shigella flexneri]
MVPIGRRCLVRLIRSPVADAGQHCFCRTAYQRVSVENRRCRRRKSRRRGGLWFGTYHLLNYPPAIAHRYTALLILTLAGCTSRNAAFQERSQ